MRRHGVKPRHGSRKLRAEQTLGLRRDEISARTGPMRYGEGENHMSIPKEIGHLVLNVTDVERSTKFYRDVVGFQVSRYRPDGTGAFLTCGVVHHNLALFKAPEGARPSEKGAIGLNHFAFKVASYQGLQEAHKRLVEAGATIDHIVDHGMTRSVYFLDPDGIEMELFCDTFATEEEGLAYMKSTRGGAAPMDITAPEPARPEIPKADYTKVG
jgi:catechol 2,3-dioxygenase